MKPNQQEQQERASGRPAPMAWQQMNRKQRREWTRKMEAEEISLQVIHPDAAGIDIGNEAHYVAVPPNRDSQPVRRTIFQSNNSHGMLTPEVQTTPSKPGKEWLRAGNSTISDLDRILANHRTD
jgi:hypothetical protein